jgi:hypothetical protein
MQLLSIKRILTHTIMQWHLMYPYEIQVVQMLTAANVQWIVFW